MYVNGRSTRDVGVRGDPGLGLGERGSVATSDTILPMPSLLDTGEIGEEVLSQADRDILLSLEGP